MTASVFRRRAIPATVVLLRRKWWHVESASAGLVLRCSYNSSSNPKRRQISVSCCCTELDLLLRFQGPIGLNMSEMVEQENTSPRAESDKRWAHKLRGKHAVWAALARRAVSRFSSHITALTGLRLSVLKAFNWPSNCSRKASCAEAEKTTCDAIVLWVLEPHNCNNSNANIK